MSSTAPGPIVPVSIRDIDHLEELLSEPSPGVIETVKRNDGDYLILGIGGKMGPTLARMIKNAANLAGVKRRVIGVSRFSTPELPAQLHSHGIETISADLLDPAALANLPDAPNVVHMASMKFGTTGQQHRTWAMNTYLPGLIANRFRQSKIVAFSSGNVYPIVPVHTGGCTENDSPVPNGEYGMSVLGRERILEHFSRTLNTPMAIIRLNFAVEMRYGVIIDMAERIWRGEPVDLTMGNLNCIWQADANAMSIQAFDHVSSPPFMLNLTGPEILSVRGASEELGALMGKTPTYSGTESGSAFLNNASLCMQLFGYPRIGPKQVIAWTADWVSRGGKTLGKPTHFEARDGKY